MHRDLRLALLVFVLIAVPTAILSLLAARAFRDWDAIVERQMVAAADQALERVTADLSAVVTHLQEQIVRFADELQRTPEAADADDRAQRLAGGNPLARQLFVGRSDGSWLYPAATPVAAQSIIAPLKSDHAVFFEQARDLQFRRNDFAGALARYNELLGHEDLPAYARGDTLLAIAQCQRRLERYDGARATLDSLASGIGVPPATRNSEGYFYRLTALRELVDLETGNSGSLSFIEPALTFLNAVAEMYPSMTVFQRQSLELYMENKLLPRLNAAGEAGGVAARLRAAEDRLNVARRNVSFHTEAAAGLRMFADNRRRAGETGWRLHDTTQSLWMVYIGEGRNSRIMGIELDRTWLIQRVRTHAPWPSQPSGELQLNVQYDGHPLSADPATLPLPGWRRLTEKEILPGQPRLTGCVWLTDPAVMRRGASIRAQLYTWGVVLLSVTALAGIAIAVHYGVAEVRRARLRGDFLAGVSHDLRTPLASMRMLAESLYQDNVTDPATRRKFLEAIVHECARLGQLTERTLYLVRYGQRALRFKLADEDMAGLVRETAAGFSGRFKEGGIDLRVGIEPDLPVSRFDGTAIGQVLYNLLENAAKYAPGTPIEIDLRAAPGRCQIYLEVRDHGPGVARRDRRRVFRNYTRGRDPRTGKVAGVGLGLALCRHIVRAHGGRILIDDAPGGGALFRVVLPCGSDV